jgi:hypothetical protein
MQGNPLLAGTGLDGFFDTVPNASAGNGRGQIRRLVSDEGAIRAAAGGLMPAGERGARGQLQALASMLSPTTAVYPRLERMLLEVPSTDLTPPQRQARLNALGAAVRAETALVQLPSSRTITLTARKGQLPITVVSQSDEPLQVLLQVKSDKLKFAGTGTANTATFPLTLHKGLNPVVNLTVVARTSGAFPLSIQVVSPDGSLTIAATKFTVQSTALSGVGVFLSVGAAVFLVVWWSRHAWKARRPARDPGGRRRHARGRAGEAAPSGVLTGSGQRQALGARGGGP